MAISTAAETTGSPNGIKKNRIQSNQIKIGQIKIGQIKTGQIKTDLISINFNNVDIRVFIKFMSNMTGKNFIIDNRVKGNVTIISPKKISIDEAYQVFESVLNINGFATVKSGKIIKIILASNAKSDNINTQLAKATESPRDKIVTRIIPLEYASSSEIKNLLTPMVPKGSIILAYPGTNILIITATLSSIKRLLKIINTLDIQSIGKKISVIPIKYADAAKLTKSLTRIFTARIKSNKNRTKNPTDTNFIVTFVEDERSNSIILLASKIETQRVEKLIKILDQEVPRGEEKIRVYYLEHASAEKLAKVLQSIPEKRTKAEIQKAPLLSPNIKITADQPTNSLVIMADKEDFPILEEVISKLDIPRAMVYLECLIMEVNVNRGLNIGTEWRASEGYSSDTKAVFGGFGGTGDSGYTNLSALNSDASLPKGFSIGMLGKNISIGGLTFPSIQAVIQAFQSDKDVHILATPQILTTENDEATITVGKNVPFQTRSAAESGTETYNSFEYKDVGITLKITPQISKGRLVRLNIFQELTKLDSVNQSSPDRPTTLKRKIETSVIVKDSNTIVIGGLIDESLTKTQTKVPCLGDVPLLGWGFKNESKGVDKTNLYVFLTPKVVQNPLEATTIYKKKNSEIQSIRKGNINLYNQKEGKNTILPILTEPFSRKPLLIEPLIMDPLPMVQKLPTENNKIIKSIYENR
jgi:general secretion pathway protein D